MIYTPRSSDTNHTCTKINFRGFEISIAMDDRCLGGNRPLTRSSLVVYKGDQEVTSHFAGLHNTDNGAILEVEGETLFEVMQAIAKETPAPMMLDVDFEGDKHLEAGERP